MANTPDKPGPGLGLVKVGPQLVAPRGLASLGRNVAPQAAGLVQQARDRAADSGNALVQSYAARAVSPEEADAEYRRVQEELRLRTQARAAIAIDFTASTNSQIAKLIAHAEDLAAGLRRNHPAGARILPVKFCGDGSWSETAFGAFGPVNELNWFRRQENLSNGRGEPPIVAGLQAILASRFFDANPEGSDALVSKTCVVISDNGFAQDRGYDDVMRAFDALGVSFASYVCPDRGLFAVDPRELQRSHESAVKPLAERGVVVMDAKGDVAPTEMIVEFASYATSERVRQIAARDPRVLAARTAAASSNGGSPMAAPTVHIPFSDALATGGLSKYAALVSQGKPALTDGNK